MDEWKERALFAAKLGAMVLGVFLAGAGAGWTCRGP